MAGKGMTKKYLEWRKQNVMKHVKEDKIYDVEFQKKKRDNDGYDDLPRI